MSKFYEVTVAVEHPENGEACAIVHSIDKQSDKFYFERAKFYLCKMADGFDWTTLRVANVAPPA